MTRKEFVTMTISVSVVLGVIFYVFFGIFATKFRELPKDAMKVTFDTIQTPGGTFTRMTDCHTNIVCYGGNGVIACSPLSEASQEFINLVRERCK